MEVLQDADVFEDESGMDSYMIYNWCSCNFTSVCSFNGTGGGCVWIGGTCTFGGTAICNYPSSCGNTTSSPESAK